LGQAITAASSQLSSAIASPKPANASPLSRRGRCQYGHRRHGERRDSGPLNQTNPSVGTPGWDLGHSIAECARRASKSGAWRMCFCLGSGVDRAGECVARAPAVLECAPHALQRGLSTAAETHRGRRRPRAACLGCPACYAHRASAEVHGLTEANQGRAPPTQRQKSAIFGTYRKKSPRCYRASLLPTSPALIGRLHDLRGESPRVAQRDDATAAFLPSCYRTTDDPRCWRDHAPPERSPRSVRSILTGW
jgi:hypothetical protein